VVDKLHALKPRQLASWHKTDHAKWPIPPIWRVILIFPMSDPHILEVPAPDLIDREFICDVFSTENYQEIKTVVEIENFDLQMTLLNFGFTKGRAFTKGKQRFQRLRLSRFDFLETIAGELMRQHGLAGSWEFVFDSAKQRAGLCNYTDYQISLSKYIVQYHTIDQSEQVILHEIAHALAGKSAGHGPNWKKIAKSLGYRGEKFTGKEIAEKTARFIGECRKGHRHYRFKSPRAQLACGYCGRGFNPRNLITWFERAA